MTAELVQVNPFIELEALHRKRRDSGDQWVFKFRNGYGASVIQGPYTYGGLSGLFELAVVVPTGDGEDDFEITYDTPITSDVLGYLSVDDVRKHLLEIAELPAQIGADDRPELT